MIRLCFRRLFNALDINCTHIQNQENHKKKKIKVSKTICNKPYLNYTQLNEIFLRKIYKYFSFYVTVIQYKSYFNVCSVTYKHQNLQICSSVLLKKIMWLERIKSFFSQSLTTFKTNLHLLLQCSFRVFDRA